MERDKDGVQGLNARFACMPAALQHRRERGKQIRTRFNFQQLQPGILRRMQTPLFAPATCWVCVQLTWGQAWKLKARNKTIIFQSVNHKALSLASFPLSFQCLLLEDSILQTVMQNYALKVSSTPEAPWHLWGSGLQRIWVSLIHFTQLTETRAAHK